MDAKELFLQQTTALLVRLKAAREAVETLDSKEGSREEASALFSNWTQGSIEELRRLRRSVAGGGLSKEEWASVEKEARSISRSCDEILPYLLSERLRMEQADDGVLDLGDGLLREVGTAVGSGWDRFVVFDAKAHFRSDSRVIRIPFPQRGVWELPVALHEFGHFVERGWQDAFRNQPSEQLQRKHREPLRTAPADGEADLASAAIDRHLQEYFADGFATYVGGPAFPWVCVVLDFHPTSLSVDVDGSTHPSYAKRVLLMHEILKRIGEGDHDAMRMATSLHDTWMSGLRSVGIAQPVTDEAQAALEDLADSMIEIFETNRIQAARFRSWHRTVAISKALALDAPPFEPQDGDSIVDVLAAAWWRRLCEPDEPLNDQGAVAACFGILAMREKA